jgi:uncharacterized protein YkwD
MRATGKKRAIAAIGAMAVALIASACAPPAAPPPPASPPPSACGGPAAPPDATSVAVLNATNASRAGAGLGPLAWNPQLWCLASEWSNHLAAINGLTHRDLSATIGSPEYAGYRTLGENLLRGPATMTGGEMHASWMGSPLHQANILSPAFNSIGFAFAFGNGQVFATENFGG